MDIKRSYSLRLDLQFLASFICNMRPNSKKQLSPGSHHLPNATEATDRERQETLPLTQQSLHAPTSAGPSHTTWSLNCLSLTCYRLLLPVSKVLYHVRSLSAGKEI